tara:strand:- start:423 stop:566 length:144 start_codon:yes stop_codon:yes gene_type:complete
MANNRFNKQVSPKGYKEGGSVKYNASKDVKKLIKHNLKLKNKKKGKK